MFMSHASLSWRGSKTHERLKNKTRQNARIFEEVLFFEATYNTKINKQPSYLSFGVGGLDASGRKRALDSCPFPSASIRVSFRFNSVSDFFMLEEV